MSESVPLLPEAFEGFLPPALEHLAKLEGTGAGDESWLEGFWGAVAEGEVGLWREWPGLAEGTRKSLIWFWQKERWEGLYGQEEVQGLFRSVRNRFLMRFVVTNPKVKLEGDWRGTVGSWLEMVDRLAADDLTRVVEKRYWELFALWCELIVDGERIELYEDNGKLRPFYFKDNILLDSKEGFEGNQMEGQEYLYYLLSERGKGPAKKGNWEKIESAVGGLRVAGWSDVVPLNEWRMKDEELLGVVLYYSLRSSGVEFMRGKRGEGGEGWIDDMLSEWLGGLRGLYQRLKGLIESYNSVHPSAAPVLAGDLRVI